MRISRIQEPGGTLSKYDEHAQTRAFELQARRERAAGFGYFHYTACVVGSLQLCRQEWMKESKHAPPVKVMSSNQLSRNRHIFRLVHERSIDQKSAIISTSSDIPTLGHRQGEATLTRSKYAQLRDALIESFYRASACFWGNLGFSTLRLRRVNKFAPQFQ